MSLLLGIKNWLLGIAAFVAMLAAAMVIGRTKAKNEQKAANADRRVQDVVLRAQIDEQNRQLPDAPAQKIADAAPETAAGRLRDDGWVR